jgi:hypothetical protein
MSIERSSDGTPSVALKSPTPLSKWLNYTQASEYTHWSVRHLRNLVSEGLIPVYGPPRSRRFRLDMLDLYLTDRDTAMRKFRLERQAHRAH